MEASFFVRVGKRNMKVQVADILYIQALKNYVNIVTSSQTYMALLSMRQLEDFLPAGLFVRIHRSYIVALQAVTAFTFEKVYVGEQVVIPIGDNYRGLLDQKVKVLYSDVRDRAASTFPITAFSLSEDDKN